MLSPFSTTDLYLTHSLFVPSTTNSSPTHYHTANQNTKTYTMTVRRCYVHALFTRVTVILCVFEQLQLTEGLLTTYLVYVAVLFHNLFSVTTSVIIYHVLSNSFGGEQSSIHVSTSSAE